VWLTYAIDAVNDAIKSLIFFFKQSGFKCKACRT